MRRHLGLHLVKYVTTERGAVCQEGLVRTWVLVTFLPKVVRNRECYALAFPGFATLSTVGPGAADEFVEGPTVLDAR